MSLGWRFGDPSQLLEDCDSKRASDSHGNEGHAYTPKAHCRHESASYEYGRDKHHDPKAVQRYQRLRRRHSAPYAAQCVLEGHFAWNVFNSQNSISCKDP